MNGSTKHQTLTKTTISSKQQLFLNLNQVLKAPNVR